MANSHGEAAGFHCLSKETAYVDEVNLATVGQSAIDKDQTSSARTTTKSCAVQNGINGGA
jgi:hypothetical protein